MATSYFKIGDHVVCEKSNVPGWEYSGKTGVIKKIDLKYEYPYYCVMDDGSDDSWCTVDCLVEDKSKEKIVITHDGKVTTATLYGEFGSKVTATARCAPEDTFDFNVGATLAMERLMEKTNPVEWRVVNRDPRVGDYIRLKTNGMYHWNKPGDILKVDVVKYGNLISIYGKNHIRPTDDQAFLWNYTGGEYEVVEKVTATEPKKPEPPKYYNGKVVCVDRGYTGLTVGKIYTFVDGCANGNYGNQITNSPVKDFNDLASRFYVTKFIEIVEDENKPLTIEELRKMDGQKVYCVRLDENAHETPDHSYCGWHTVNLKEAKLFDNDGKHWKINANGKRYGYHAYRQAPLK